MFRNRKVQEFSFVKTSKKFLNDKESFQRVKHLRCIIDNISENDLKTFFKKHYSLIFNAFYDVFINVQIELQQKVNTSHYKELQYILAVFEKILVLLPEFIKSKWQYNCIFTIIRTLLHHNNILKIRLQGMQLYILWFKILAHNAPKSCYDIFISLIPIFEPIIKKIICTDSQKLPSNLSENITSINEIEMKPVLTQNLDKEVELEDVDQYLLRYLLRYMATESIKVEWDEERDEKQLASYTFIIDQFKEFFLPVIFPKCSSDYTIEKNMKQNLISAEFLEHYSPTLNNYPIEGNKIFKYQEEVIRWMAELICIDYSSHFSNMDTRLKQSDVITEEALESTVKAHVVPNKVSTIDNVLIKFDKENLRIGQSAIEKIHEILFQNDDNVNIINQLCQHAFYLPLQFYKTHLSIIFVYKSWLFPAENVQPPFMIDTDVSSPVVMRGISTFNDSINEVNQKVKISLTMQRVIFTNVATVFLHKYQESEINQRSSPTKKQQMNSKQHHSDLAKRIMAGIYRRAVNGISNLDNEHLMNVLLDISFNVLGSNTPCNRPDNHWISNDTSIGQFFQTLNVLLIKSNLITYISDELWNRFLQVYSSLVLWIPVVSEWKKMLELILKMLGKILYNVDMNDLPLEKKARRGRPANNLKRGNGSKLLKRVFSSEDQIKNAHSFLDPNQSNTMNYNSSLNSTLNIHPKTTFTEHLNQNTDEAPFSVDNISHNAVISDTEDLNQVETSKKFQFDESNENDAGSFASSSHEENSSYMSAEDSSSPHSFQSAMDHFYTSSRCPSPSNSTGNRYLNVPVAKMYLCKDKAIDVNSGLTSDNECLPSSLSGGDTSIEINGSFDMSVKPLFRDEHEDNNIDADDEYDGEINNSVFPVIFDGESKSATLTRDESDIDISSQFYRFGDQDNINDSSRTPTKYTLRKKTHFVKDKDRNSMHLDDNIDNVITTDEEFSNRDLSSENVNCRHVLLGGTVIGWNQESAVLLWKRCICLFGNVTHIHDTDTLLTIFEYFSDFTNSLIKMRENMCIPISNQITPQPPLYVPPIDYIVPWLFEIFNREPVDDTVKIVALKTLCRITVRKVDNVPSTDHLVQFYSLIHSIIHNGNMTFICTLIEHLGVHLFSMPLCGSEVIINDIIKACEIILKFSALKPSDVKMEKLPKLEAVSILGSLLKLQDHYGTIKSFDSTSKDIKLLDSVTYKIDILQLITYSAKNEPHVSSRALCITIIALHCYSELIKPDILSSELNDVRQSILLLLSLMRFNNNEVATISVDMIRFLVISYPEIHEKLPNIPEKIIQTLSWTINNARIRFKRSQSQCAKRLITSMIFTLVDWCMSLPLNQLLESNDLHPKGLVHLAFSALENVLKYDEFTIAGKCSTTSSLKETINEKNPSFEARRTSTILSSNQQQCNFNVAYNISTDPLIEFPSLFELQPTQEIYSKPSSIPEEQDQSTSSDFSFISGNANEMIKLAARTALCHLINHIGQFPKNNVLGCLSTCVQEHHDFQVCKVKQISDNGQENSTSDELSSDVFSSPDLQMFVVNGSMIVSMLAINTQIHQKLSQNPSHIPAPGGPPICKPLLESVSKESEVRIIIRDLCGKYSWDVTFVHRYEDDPTLCNTNPNKEIELMPPSPPPRRTLPAIVVSEKSPTQKPINNERVTSDIVDVLLEDLSSLSPEILSVTCNKLSSPDSPQTNLEALVKQQISDQDTIECNYFNSNHCFKLSHPKFVEKKLRSDITIEKSPEIVVPKSKFYFCRQILNQLGFLSLKRRASIDLIQKSNIYLHLKCIDGLRSRETHKVAVLYVGWGQEDKESILGNIESSIEFNNFISGLGWTVDLEVHRGFMGGLESNGKNGKYAPYYANSTLEVMFHVSTWMQSSLPEDKPNKFKHLGNDEVMVIWSENYRDFRSNITKTEFGDVMIIIYPLRNGLFCINIKTKVELKLFGPLFNGSIVGEKELSGLVRSTAINAGRSIRESKPRFEEYFVERANYMQKAIKKFTEPMTFEAFAENIYGVPLNNLDESIRSAATSDNTKSLLVKATDASPPSANIESIPSNKGIARLSTSPKSNQKQVIERSHTSFDDSVDHNFNRKLSKINRHLK